MKILMLVQIFETHEDTGSDRHYFFAKSLVAAGFEVEVLTANVDYKNAKKRFESASGLLSKDIDGVKVTYLPVYTNFRGSFVRRMIFFLSFFARACMYAFNLKGIHAVYAVSTPLTNGFLGAILSKIKKAKMLFEVTDVWPDAAVHTGVVKSRTLIALAEMMGKFCYRMADTIIALTSGIKSEISAKGISGTKIIVIPNGVDTSLFTAVQRSEQQNIREKYHIRGKFVAMYMGAHGAYNGLKIILEAAMIVRENPLIEFVFVGDGDEKGILRTFVEKNGLRNVTFLGTVKRSDCIELLSASDIFLLPNRKGDFFRGNLPNKIFDYLASARPIVVSGFGETSDLVAKAEAGFTVAAEDAGAFADQIVKLFETKSDDRMIMGSRGRKYVLDNYDRKEHVLEIKKLLDYA